MSNLDKYVEVHEPAVGLSRVERGNGRSREENLYRAAVKQVDYPDLMLKQWAAGKHNYDALEAKSDTGGNLTGFIGKLLKKNNGVNDAYITEEMYARLNSIVLKMHAPFRAMIDVHYYQKQKQDMTVSDIVNHTKISKSAYYKLLNQSKDQFWRFYCGN